ncbi:PIR protein, putative [Plasmodium sp. gorilla clade G1]|nr:PIR protein, putative [Plasmodium sp. gorilla clade G1]
MKLHYKRVLYSLALNILVSSSYEDSKNKPYITQRHTSTTTSRVLSECDIPTLNYDNDADMKSVKENFDRRTSQRFEEYEERMKKKRQKCKEQCDKDIQKIILKNKMETSLAEKVEKGCLRCGCGLGGVAAGVGIIGPIAVNEWTKAALIAAKSSAIAEGTAAGEAAGHAEGAAKLIEFIKSTLGIERLAFGTLDKIIDAKTYHNAQLISRSIYSEYLVSNCTSLGTIEHKPICSIFTKLVVESVNGQAEGPMDRLLELSVQSMVSDAEGVAKVFTNSATEEAIATLIPKKTGAVNATYASCQTAIIASVVAILVIVLVMVIIYLILRYRRKKKMNKKLQYTKLLNK